MRLETLISLRIRAYFEGSAVEMLTLVVRKSNFAIPGNCLKFKHKTMRTLINKNNHEMWASAFQLLTPRNKLILISFNTHFDQRIKAPLFCFTTFCPSVVQLFTTRNKLAWISFNTHVDQRIKAHIFCFYMFVPSVFRLFTPRNKLVWISFNTHVDQRIKAHFLFLLPNLPFSVSTAYPSN